MLALMRSLRLGFGRLWRNDARLTATASFMLLLLAAFSVGLLVDPRVVTGVPVWLKPAKFAASIAIYALTLSWIFGWIPRAVRTRRMVSWGTAAAMLVEIGIIALQAARGTTSHFNVGSPLNATLFAIMGMVIVAQTLSTVAVAVALFRQVFEDRALGWALRLGMLITIAGALLGGLMTRPTAQQLTEMRDGQVTLSGAHTVGAPDGGPGMPVMGWSTEHGDLRIPHFVALHALQVLPLLAVALRRTRTSSGQRARLLLGFAASYGALVGILLWQALAGQALLGGGPGFISALFAWLGLTAVVAWRSLAASTLSQQAAALPVP